MDYLVVVAVVVVAVVVVAVVVVAVVVVAVVVVAAATCVFLRVRVGLKMDFDFLS